MLPVYAVEFRAIVSQPTATPSKPFNGSRGPHHDPRNVKSLHDWHQALADPRLASSAGAARLDGRGRNSCDLAVRQ